MKQILLVDDDALYTKILSYILENSGFIVECATDGTEAIAMVDAKNYDLVVTDLIMPGTTGFELLTKIKGTGNSNNTKVIVISVHTSEYYISESFTRGADDYLKKPVTAKDLVHSIRRLLVSKAA